MTAEPIEKEMRVRVLLIDQVALREAHYQLDGLMRDEQDQTKKAQLKEVCEGLWAITNYYGTEAIGSADVLTDEYIGKDAG